MDKQEIANKITKLTNELVDLHDKHAEDLYKLKHKFYGDIDKLQAWVHKLNPEIASSKDLKLALAWGEYLTDIYKIMKGLNDSCKELSELAIAIRKS